MLYLCQWLSTWVTGALDGTQKYLTGYVKLKKEVLSNILFSMSFIDFNMKIIDCM
jgi:hypothetical protein